MSDQFQFDDEFYPVPPAAVDADPAATMRDLFFRVSRLEQSLEEQRVQATQDMKAVLLSLLSLYDDITNTIERYGVTTSAQEAAVVRSVVATGRTLLDLLGQLQVTPIDTIGKPPDPETSDVVDTEQRDGAAPNTVLREVQIGYTWPHGLLRRARVVVNRPATDENPSRAG
jgi:molecular chaperone GrpE (heat shock protein)